MTDRRGGGLTIQGLSVSADFEGERALIIDDVSISLEPGKIHGVAGESGSGKTVTALASMQLLRGTGLRLEEGSIRLGTDELIGLSESELRQHRGSRISMVFQEPMTSLDPCFRIGELLSETIRSHKKVSGGEARKQAVELLDRVGIPDPDRRMRAYPFQMSGGQLQRVLIAMAIASSPGVLIADEPTTALDVTVQAQILDLVRQLSNEGMAVMLVTHDLALMAEYAQFLTVMYAGQVVETGPTAEVLASPAHPYTSGLVGSIPSVHRRAELHSISGRVPLPTEKTEGCRFAARCRFAQPECHVPVALTTVADNRYARCVRANELSLDGYAK